MSDFLAAAVQLTSGSDPESNFSAAEEQIELAARRGAELVGLPENFAYMGDDARRLELAPALAEQCQRFLVTMACRYQVAILGGGFPVPVGDGQHTYQRAQLVGRDGQLLSSYDKITCLMWICLTAAPIGNRRVSVPEAPIHQWSAFPASAGWGCPFATTCGSLSSTAISSAMGPRC